MTANLIPFKCGLWDLRVKSKLWKSPSWFLLTDNRPKFLPQRAQCSLPTVPRNSLGTGRQNHVKKIHLRIYIHAQHTQMYTHIPVHRVTAPSNHPPAASACSMYHACRDISTNYPSGLNDLSITWPKKQHTTKASFNSRSSCPTSQLLLNVSVFPSHFK